MESHASAAAAPNVTTHIAEVWRQNPDRVAFQYEVDDGHWVSVTSREAQEQIDAVAKGLIASGVATGEHVGIMSRTRFEWTVLDFAIWSAGAIPIPIYDTSSAEQVDWITSDADVALLFVENDTLATLVADIATGENPLRTVKVIERGALEALAESGTSVSDATLAERRGIATRGDLATIIYTSGTTGRPKGVRLTHANFLRQTEGVQERLPEVLFQEGASTILFMTLAHVFARLVEVALVSSGTLIAFCPDATRLVPAMAAIRPTLILAVPRVFEKVYNGAEQKATASGKLKIFRWAAHQAISYSRALDTPAGPSAALKAKYKIADALVLKKIRAVLGGRAKWAISGSAPLGERLGHFFRGVGLNVLEAYGLTETTAGSHINRPGKSKIGTVGAPLPGMEIRFADDGEILMRGELLFDGYHHNPEATAAATREGWFYSGDIGHADSDGYLTITGRKKEIIVTAGGKNVAPAVLEDRVRAHPVVSQCVVVGDAKPFIAALITLDADALPLWLKSQGHPEMSVAEARKAPEVRAAIDQAIARANKAVSRAESVRKYEILDTDFTIMNGYLTPSMKVKRDRVLKDFSADVEALYADVKSD